MGCRHAGVRANDRRTFIRGGIGDVTDLQVGARYAREAASPGMDDRHCGRIGTNSRYLSAQPDARPGGFDMLAAIRLVVTLSRLRLCSAKSFGWWPRTKHCEGFCVQRGPGLNRGCGSSKLYPREYVVVSMSRRSAAVHGEADTRIIPGSLKR